MAKTKISEFNANPALNTDIDSINIAEGCAPSGINDAIRELMSQLKDWQSGTSNDPYVVGSSGSLTLNQGTANGVAYLNGSKVVTSGSNLTFDGTTLFNNTNSGGVSFTAYSSGETSERTTYSATAGLQIAAYQSVSGSPYTKAADIVANADGTAPSLMRFWVKTSGSSSPAEAMRLTSTGLGIGTSSPASLLTLYGATSQIHFTNTNTGTTTGDGMRIGMGGGSSTDGFINLLESTNLIFNTGGSERMRLDSSGNLGLGVTPSAWISAYKALEIGTTTGLYGRTDSTMEFALALNSYRASSGSWIYRNTGAAARYNQNSGAHWWDIAASGTAGNAITFTQAMTLDASGNLAIGSTTATSRANIWGANVATGAGVTASHGQLSVWSTTTYGANIGGTLALGGDGGTYNNITYATVSGRKENGSINNYDGYLAFSVSKDTSNTVVERARIDSSGNLLVGTTSNGGAGGLSVSPNITNGAPQIVWNRASTTGTSYASDFRNAGTTVGYIAYTNTTVTYNTGSDYRLKHDIAPMTGALAKVAALKPVTYKWNADDSNGEGFIAHELAEVVPQCVTGEKDAVDADGKPVYQGIDTSFLVATLTAAIQELNAKFEAYKASHP